ncbi:MAG: M55 family metallopeptidase [Candidatus Melainabacteria bacterium]|nr:M55 family metallopeptidase [Candidatus Melainabacteria bacterium]
MRAYISVDLEGINGICHSSQTQPGEPGYERAVQLMHAETNAVIKGLLKAGCDEIVVNDSHWDMRNLRIELMHPKAHLVSGWQKPFSMVSGVQTANKPDFACFVGYHARQGCSTGVLSHTYRATVFRDVRINDVLVGETGLNAYLAGAYDVPIALITGDDALKRECEDLMGKVNSVVVKNAVSRYSACFKPQAEVLEQLEKSAYEAAKAKTSWKLLKPPTPAKLTLSMNDTSMADACELVPNVKRLNDRDVEFSDQNYSVVFRVMLALGALGASRKDQYFS